MLILRLMVNLAEASDLKPSPEKSPSCQKPGLNVNTQAEHSSSFSHRVSADIATYCHAFLVDKIDSCPQHILYREENVLI